MKFQPANPNPDIARSGAAIRVPPIPAAIDSRAAANDGLVRDEERDKSPDPLWIVNIAMAAFFISTALIMMFS